MSKKLKAAGVVERKTLATTPVPKRGKAAKPVEPPRVYTAAQKKEARERLEICHDELGAIQGSLRNKAGQMKKLVAECASVEGVSQASIRWALSNRKRDPQEIDNETRERTRAARFFNIKIGTQLGLFDTGEGKGRSVGDQVERDENASRGGTGKAASKASIEAAKKQGASDGKLGKGFNCKHPDGSPEYLGYAGAYRSEQEALAAKLGKGGTNTSGAAASAAAH